MHLFLDPCESDFDCGQKKQKQGDRNRQCFESSRQLIRPKIKMPRHIGFAHRGVKRSTPLPSDMPAHSLGRRQITAVVPTRGHRLRHDALRLYLHVAFHAERAAETAYARIVDTRLNNLPKSGMPETNRSVHVVVTQRDRNARRYFWMRRSRALKKYSFVIPAPRCREMEINHVAISAQNIGNEA